MGGQAMVLLDNTELIDGMVTFAGQSGHWRLQGGEQKIVNWIHMHITLPVLSTLFGYMPMKLLGSGENVPKGVAIEWARWCRDRNYLLSDKKLPIERYKQCKAPVLAYSCEDDKWGTRKSVDAMMCPYPKIERRHLIPSEFGLSAIGHFGYFRPEAKQIWIDVINWLNEH